jgi:Transglycosylase SLT domain
VARRDRECNVERQIADILEREVVADFDYLTDQFFIELKAVCGRLSCAPADMLGIMESESAVRPDAQNPRGNATGLIQFMPRTLVGLGWNLGPAGFKKLSAEQQMPFVEAYFKPWISFGLSSAGRLYQAVFLPGTLRGSDESTVIAAPAGPNAGAYKSNVGLDMNHDGAITVSDLTARIDHFRQGPRWIELMRRLNAV